MKHQHKPRKDDHLVEPLYGAIHKSEASREDTASRAGAEPRAADWRWKIVWVIVGAFAIGYVVWRQAF
jgi:hypothetical protein